MVNLDLTRIQEARRFLCDFFPPTRLVPAPYLSCCSGFNVYLKLETELPTGSFKPRGALVALAARLQKETVRQVVTSSTGNHGAAVAYAARQLGVSATIFLPTHPNPVKRAQISELGADIVEIGTDLSEAVNAARTYAQDHGAFFLDDAVNEDIPIGTATIGSEILEQLPGTDCIYVPVGDTALIRGIAAVAKSMDRKIKIVGIQAERASSYHASWNAGHVLVSELCDTIADGLATNRPTRNNVETIRGLVDEMRLVSEEEMLRAVRCLLLEEQILSEPSGAASTAALLQDPLPETARTIVLIVSGKNVTDEIRRRAMATDLVEPKTSRRRDANP